MTKTKRFFALFVLVLAFYLLCIGSITVPAEGNTCLNCGKDIPEGAVICSSCGQCTECQEQNVANSDHSFFCGAVNENDTEMERDEEGNYGEGCELQLMEALQNESSGEDYAFSQRMPAPYWMTNITKVYVTYGDTLEDVRKYDLDFFNVENGMRDPTDQMFLSRIYAKNPLLEKFSGREDRVGIYHCYIQSGQLDFGPLNVSRYKKDGYEVVFEREQDVIVDRSITRISLKGVDMETELKMKAKYYEYLLVNANTGEELFFGGVHIPPYSPGAEEFMQGYVDPQSVVSGFVEGYSGDRLFGYGGGYLSFGGYNEIIRHNGPLDGGWKHLYCVMAYTAPYDYSKKHSFSMGGSYVDVENEKVSVGNRIVQLDNGTYVTVDENGVVNADPSYKGIIKDQDGVIRQISGETLPVPDYRDYEVGDIVTVGGVAFVLLLVAGVPTWVGPGGIGLDGKSLIPEDGPADTGPKPEPAEPDTPKEPQEEVTPTDEDTGGETGTDGWKETAGYITEAMKGTPIVTEIMDLLLVMGEKGVNVGKLAGPLASAGFEFIDFTAQGSDAVTAGIKTLISAGMKMAAGAGATYTDAALNLMKYEFCEFAKQFENFTGIDTSGIQDMASRITSSVSPGENLKNTAGVMVDFFREGYKCFVTKEGNEFTTGLIEGYRSGKYGENMKNMQLSIDMINDYFSGKPVLEEIRTGLGQMLEETNQSISDYISKGLMGQ